MPNSDNYKKRKIGIIGAGAMGVAVALEIKERFPDLFDVEIYEALKDILEGSSGGTPGRMGFGYHYSHPETALKYLEYTISFIKKFPQSIKNNDLEGRYFITNNSLVDAGSLLKVYSMISEAYKEIAQNDPDIMRILGGSPFSHKFLEIEDYKDYVPPKNVKIAVATIEKIFDIDKFRSDVRDQLSKLGVKIYFNTKISKIIKNKDGFNLEYEMVGESAAGKKRKIREDQLDRDVISVDQLVECTWNKSEEIIKQFATVNNLELPDIQTFSSRLKILAEVDLPECLVDKPHSFFCVGPFAMFTNEASKDRSQKVAKITYANITNVLGYDQIAECKDKNRRELWQKIYGQIGKEFSIADWHHMVDNGDIAEDIAQTIGAEIIKGVSEYIPDMINAKLRRLLPGYVLSSQEGGQDISCKDSKIHRRDESGVDEICTGFFSAKALKLFGCVDISNQLIERMFPEESRQRRLKLDSAAKYKELVGKFSMMVDESGGQDIKPSLIKYIEGVFDRGCEYSQKNISRAPSSAGSSHSVRSSDFSSLSPSLSSPAANNVYKRPDNQGRDKDSDKSEQGLEVLLVNALMDCGGKEPGSSVRQM